MSLPPVTVHIKRKATDEPVDYLQIHHGESSGKRQKLATPSNYIFSRQPTENPGGSASSPVVPQTVRRIKQLHRSASSQALDASAQSSSQENQANSNSPGQDVGSLATPSATPPPKSPTDPTHTPRRFHMSRSATLLGPSPNDAGRKRKGLEPAVFVERRARPRSSEGQTPRPGEAEQTYQDRTGPGFSTPQPEDRPRKKPGLASRSSTPPVKATAPPRPNVAPLRNVRLPSGAVIPWDVSSERLAAEMQAYTLEEISRTLAAQEPPKPEPKPISSPASKQTTSRFKPKKPAMRYAERHPEEKPVGDTAMEIDEPFIEDEDMDGEYIIDTYVRIPAEALEVEEHQKNFGLLVLDSQPEIDEFYREEEDSDEEEEDEEEDENAENHYTADYPDEEVASDDEYDRNTYHYRTGNASDLEEFDEDDDEAGANFSGDEDESTRYPWAIKPTRPWMKKPEKGILDEDVDE